MLPIVFVVWNDAVLRRDLNDTTTIMHTAKKLESVGFLLRSDEKGVSIATDYDPEDLDYREQSFIPRGMILEEKIFT